MYGPVTLTIFLSVAWICSGLQPSLQQTVATMGHICELSNRFRVGFQNVLIACGGGFR